MTHRKEVRSLLRTAQDILDNLPGRRSKANVGDIPAEAWEHLRRCHHRWQTAMRRGWLFAAEMLERDVYDANRSLVERLEKLVPMRPALHSDAAAPTLSTIHHDLVALQFEFPSVGIDRQQHRLSVTTEPIVLEGVHLGPFEIVLDWSKLDGNDPYHVVSLDPCCADDASGTTHPHISNESLCEGEGHVPIRSALRQGRFLDFFVLVRQILSTYNPGSAYVQLERWNGIECRDCGLTTGSDDSTTCDRCHCDICIDCSGRCNACERTCCGGCRRECEECRDERCNQCLESCSGCDLEFCDECLVDGHCGVCRAEKAISHENQDPNIPAPTSPVATSPDPAIHALCLGEAPVPA